VIFLLALPGISTAQDKTTENARKADRHEFVKRGVHASELPLGDYVIVSVFQTEDNAKAMKKEYVKQNFPEAQYGYLTNKQLWYIYFGVTTGIEEAKKKRDEFRKNQLFQDAWLLTVHQ
jgi:hypothetical protein